MSAAAQPEPLGDVALTLRIAGGSATEVLGRVRALAAALAVARLPGTTDVVPSPAGVTIAFDPLAIGDRRAFTDAVAATVRSASAAAPPVGVRHEIPVAYDGADVDEVAALHGIAPTDLVARHAAADYLVEALGFLPGFGYLGGLPPALATPRRATPRRTVPAGAVGIGGEHTGVYPCASPGGWNLVGRTSTRLFDPAAPRPALLAVGDHVRFIPVDLPPAWAPVAPPPLQPPRPAITVEHPGLFTTVQDLGRRGYRASGVPTSGAADVVALRLANRLVGNADDAAALECTLLGPRLRCERAVVVALVGATFPGLPPATVVRLPAGAVLDVGHATAGCRGYLAIAGGLEVPPVLGSRSTLVAAGLGGNAGRPLVAGDRLATAAADGRPGSWSASRLPDVLRTLPEAAGIARLRVIPAPDVASGIWSRTYRVSGRSDRMGMRLEGEAVVVPPTNLPSAAVFPGTVQLPPDGRPIVLLADAQTIGGYPVIGQVIAADLPRAAQLRPGDAVGWMPVDVEAADAALRAQAVALAGIPEAPP